MRRWLGLIPFLLCAAGAMAQDYPAPIRVLRGQGVAIQSTMQAPPGFKGYVGNYQGDAIPVYLLPDGKHVLVGTLYDSRGKDLTAAAFRSATAPGLDPALWQQLQQSTWIAEGAVKPERVVYVFTDTECPYCHQLWLDTRQYLHGGKVQMRNVIVAVIKPESLPRGAAVLVSADPAATFLSHEQTFGHSGLKPLASIDAGTRAKMEANKNLMLRFKAVGTPVTVYRDGNGRIRMIQGIPDRATLRGIFGG